MLSGQETSLDQYMRMYKSDCIVTSEEAHKIYHLFFWDWATNDYKGWESIIKSKDLGVVCTNIEHDLYEVTDQKKWLLAKIKYGI